MLHIGAQILNGSIRTLLVIPIGVVNIPECCQIVTGKLIHQSTKSGSVCIDAAGLDQQADAPILCIGQQLSQSLIYPLFPLLQSTDYHIGHLRHLRCGNQIKYGLQLLRGNITRAIQAGNAQLLLPQLSQSCGDLVLMEGSPLLLQLGFVEIIDLNAAEAHIQSCVHQLLPGQIQPTTGRKRQLHTPSSSYTILFSALR